AEETYRVLGLALAVEGDHEESERVLREASAMPEAGSYTKATLGYALARAGRRDEAEVLVAELESERERGYVSPVALATVYLGLGDATRALAWAEHAYEERRGWLAYLNVNPIFDAVRGDERFESLVRRMRHAPGDR
ncbi:MAG: tetratricopeptide repeat protein, partial [Gemmatimonadaceae bacterium]